MDMIGPLTEPHALRDYLELLKTPGDRNVVYDLWGITNCHPDLVNKPWSDQFGNWTPLLFVCYQWLTQELLNRCSAGKLIEVLLNQGANPNETGLVMLDGVWIDDVTPLYLAARSKSQVVVEMLLVAGADAEKVTSNKETVLHSLFKSASMGPASALDKVLAQMFIKNGVDINAQDDKGRTLLHHFVRSYSHAQFESFSMLIKQGASVEAKDHNGCNILELAANEGHLGLVEALLALKSWNSEEAAQAYELLGQNFSGRSCYEMMMQGTQIRQKGECPKEIQKPLACYGGVTEWKTERDLSGMRDASDFLDRQCQIARERIFKDRVIGLQQMNEYIIRCLGVSDPRVKLLIQRQIELFHRNGDYTAFSQVFFRYRMDPGILLQLLLTGDECGMIPEFLKLAVDCCKKLKDCAKKSVTLVDFRNSTHALEKTALIALRLIHHLKNKCNVTQQLGRLSKLCDIEIPAFDYRQTLLLIYLSPMHLKELPDKLWLNIELTAMITNYSNCNVMDNCNNNCLHLAIVSSFGNPKVAPIIKCLIKEGIHYDVRNTNGFTAEDIAKKAYSGLYSFLRENRSVPKLKCLCAQVIKIHVTHFQNHLPKLLGNFVALH